MDNNSVFGIPLLLIGFGCFILAGIFYFVWPRPKKDAPARPYWTNLMLHYLHPLAWVLLGIASIEQHKNIINGVILAASGGVSYVVFIVLLMKDRKKQISEKAEPAEF